MPLILTDNEIAALRNERKMLPAGWERSFQLRPQPEAGHERQVISVTGNGGHESTVKMRRNARNQLNFSIILVYWDDEGHSHILVRYNGKHPSQHTNVLEKRQGMPGSVFRNQFHIHYATERYQREFPNKPIESFAVPTKRYASFEAALHCFLEDNGFVSPG